MAIGAFQNIASRFFQRCAPCKKKRPLGFSKVLLNFEKQ
jgi:hypothetical protein